MELGLLGGAAVLLALLVFGLPIIYRLIRWMVDTNRDDYWDDK